jgi:hypothetical protein
MLRYDNGVCRLMLPELERRSAWLAEEERLGLQGLDDSLEFMHAAMRACAARTEGYPSFPCKKFGKPEPSSNERGEGPFSRMYLGAALVFGKSYLWSVPLSRFFAKLPDGFFTDTALRRLEADERILADKARRKGRVFLTNHEIAALETFERNNKDFVEGGRWHEPSAWGRV